MTVESVDKPLRQIGMSSPSLSNREQELVEQVLRSNILSIGPVVEDFERRIAGIAGTRHAVAVNSGTAGLHECIVAAGIGDGDEVITSSFSFVASANAIAYERARPVFVDIDPATLNIDPNLIEDAITPKTRAIMPVHVFGQPADMDPILEIAKRRNLAVIEDSCEAIGAHYKGRPAGSLGDAGVFAFYPNKQVTTAEGGVIVTDDERLAGVYRSLRNQGRDVHDGWLQHTRLGFNYRMSEVHAAIGVAQLERFDELMARRARVAAAYKERIAAIDGVEPPAAVPTTTRDSWFVYVIRLASWINREKLIIDLQARGVPTRPYFPPIHLQPHYRAAYGLAPGDLPHTEALAERTLALPFHADLPLDEIDYVCESIRDFVRRA
jgi:perosamine synthetase